MSRGYFGIGIYHPVHDLNIGGLWRAAYNLEAKYIFTIGRKYKTQASDTVKTPCQIPLFHYSTFDEFLEYRPKYSQLIGIEQTPQSRPIYGFVHPEQAIYLLGSETEGLPNWIWPHCQHVIQINTPVCMNVHVAGSIVMYDRQFKFLKS